MKIILFLCLSIPMIMNAQFPAPKEITTNQRNGIRWITGFTWEQIKEKARAENKIIFIDAFATWCKPCKMMESEVFSRKEIGEVINEKFIPIRVQMDKTGMDDDFTKSWYKSAKVIEKDYLVTAYPTVLFVSSEGTLINRSVGYKDANTFLRMAAMSSGPRQIYKNPYEEYLRLLKAYRNGKRQYKKMPYMIGAAKKLKQQSIVDSLSRDYILYLKSKPSKNLFRKENIEFIASDLEISDNPFKWIFYSQAKKVDKVMKRKEYSRFVVDKVIEKEVIKPAIKKCIKSYTLQDIKKWKIELNWDSIYRGVSDRYDTFYAARAVRSAKFIFYWTTRNDSMLILSLVQQIYNNDLDTINATVNAYINSTAWKVFQLRDDQAMLNEAIGWIRGVIRRRMLVANSVAAYYDTYANLVYKSYMINGIGSKEYAIQLEELAIKNAEDAKLSISSIQGFIATCEKMKSGVPTWKFPPVDSSIKE